MPVYEGLNPFLQSVYSPINQKNFIPATENYPAPNSAVNPPPANLPGFSSNNYYFNQAPMSFMSPVSSFDWSSMIPLSSINYGDLSGQVAEIIGTSSGTATDDERTWLYTWAFNNNTNLFSTSGTHGLFLDPFTNSTGTAMDFLIHLHARTHYPDYPESGTPAKLFAQVVNGSGTTYLLHSERQFVGGYVVDSTGGSATLNYVDVNMTFPVRLEDGDSMYFYVAVPGSFLDVSVGPQSWFAYKTGTRLSPGFPTN